jgi:hypothetical protein
MYRTYIHNVVHMCIRQYFQQKLGTNFGNTINIFYDSIKVFGVFTKTSIFYLEYYKCPETARGTCVCVYLLKHRTVNKSRFDKRVIQRRASYCLGDWQTCHSTLLSVGSNLISMQEVYVCKNIKR